MTYWLVLAACIALIVWIVLTLRGVQGEKPDRAPRRDVRRVLFEEDRET